VLLGKRNQVFPDFFKLLDGSMRRTRKGVREGQLRLVQPEYVAGSSGGIELVRQSE